MAWFAKRIKQDQVWPIVTFTADTRQYVPTSISHPLDGEVHHTEMEIPLGHSRYGGPIMDLPRGIELPRGLRFAAQLDLSVFSPCDVTGLLPKAGQLLFFADIRKEVGTVIHADVANSELVRTVVEHEDDFYSGVLIKNVQAGSERWAERFARRGQWDEFFGSNTSKMFGAPVHCQWPQQKVEEMLLSGRQVLLQIGENGFNDEGVFSVFIDQKDLASRDFSRCEFTWAQT
jgi:uncharacterized protein YwqG